MPPGTLFHVFLSTQINNCKGKKIILHLHTLVKVVRSVVEMLNKKNEKKAEWKDKELEIRQQELNFNKMKFEFEAEERRERYKLEFEERKAMIELLRKHV